MLKRITSSEFRRLYLPQVLEEGLNVENLANTERFISVGGILNFDIVKGVCTVASFPVLITQPHHLR